MVSCIIDARPTKIGDAICPDDRARSSHGAGARRSLVLDHSGNHLRLALVTDIHHERLDDGEPRNSSAEDKERQKPLPGCARIARRSCRSQSKICPECGKLREARTEIEHVHGELVELGARPTKRSATQAIAEQEDFYGELRWIASVRGYAAGLGSP